MRGVLNRMRGMLNHIGGVLNRMRGVYSVCASKSAGTALTECGYVKERRCLKGVRVRQRAPIPQGVQVMQRVRPLPLNDIILYCCGSLIR